jgi:hypothetical protein
MKPPHLAAALLMVTIWGRDTARRSLLGIMLESPSPSACVVPS